jgi:hypothetical protein
VSYSDLIRQENDYTYSANIQYDIESDTKLLRFIPNETTIKLLREYFTDIARAKPFSHARILYGSYGTGKSHFLTVLSQILGKTFVDGVAYSTFIARVREYDDALANDIESYINATERKPLLIVPIVFDFDNFDRCIYFSLKKKLDVLGYKINYRTFYDQAEALLSQWQGSEESSARLDDVCNKKHINLIELQKGLASFDPRAGKTFDKLFAGMTFGVKYVYEVSNMSETLKQANAAISDAYSGIVFIFDEFGRYIEDNIKNIKVKSVQDLAEYCDHYGSNNHIILVSHKEISQYTQRYGKTIAAEWKKVEGRYQANSINNKQDQCLSLIRSILIKNKPAWQHFKTEYNEQLNRIYSEAMGFKGFLVDVAREDNPFEGGFPLHPIALFTLDRLSKKVAQNDRTFFTYLASKEENSLYRFLISHELNEFHFVGINDIYDYFEPSIKAVQSDDSYKWYKVLQSAFSKNRCDAFDDLPEVKILKVIATIGIVNDSSALVADKRTIISTIDCPEDVLENALVALCDKKIIKYSGMYDRYEFFDASIFDVESMIEEESIRVSREAVIKTLNDNFVKFVLYPNAYNRAYKISRVFIPVFASLEDLPRKTLTTRLGAYYDGVLVMLVGNSDVSAADVIEASQNLSRSVIWVNNNCSVLVNLVKKFIAAQYIETQKAKYIEKDPGFEKELQYHIREITAEIDLVIDDWKRINSADIFVVCNGEAKDGITSMNHVAELASNVMFEIYPETLLINNELINKNIISGSITAAKKNAIRAILSSELASNYFGLQYLSPDYIAVRSVLAKNGFITTDECDTVNALPSGKQPQIALKQFWEEVIGQAKKGTVECSQVYSVLKKPPYGLRDGYLSLILACILSPYKKSLIISSHGTEQEITAELIDEIIKRPDDFCFTVADWNEEQLAYINQLEKLFGNFINTNLLSKNRLKAIYDAMMAHYKTVSKFARTTEGYVSEQAKAYRTMMEKSYSSYSKFFFNKSKALAGNYLANIDVISSIKEELEDAVNKLCRDLKYHLCNILSSDAGLRLADTLHQKYLDIWVDKRQKAFDYYTNAFLDYVANMDLDSSDQNIISKLAKLLTGIELTYWSDKHIADFKSRLEEVITKLNNYVVNGELQGNETKMTLTTAAGEEKAIVFDNTGLSDLSVTIKNKIIATFGNFGLSVSYDDKTQILLSLLNDLMEGK